jgi:hypothetical protein
MRTKAEEQFNSEYQVLRSLLVLCKVSKQKVQETKVWVRHEGLITAEKAEQEMLKRLSSKSFVKQLQRESAFEKDEGKVLKSVKDEDD